jgi:hypothetical protein
MLFYYNLQTIQTFSNSFVFVFRKNNNNNNNSQQPSHRALVDDQWEATHVAIPVIYTFQ